MRLLYIIGNGFDISLGMKTGYPDFYDYYLSLPSGDSDIAAMKDSINKQRYETWADLEIGLGKYTSSVSSPIVFLKCLDDIRAHLREYIMTQFDARDYYLDRDKMLNYFLYPGLFLDAQVASRFDTYLRAFDPRYESKKEISVISLNYTSTLEEIIGKVTDFRILHLHGTLDSGMVVGVNSSDQIQNESFRNDIDIIESFVKPEYNDSCLNDKNDTAKTMINQADLIVFFGTSLGDSDKTWWKMIGSRIIDPKDRVLLVYFPYDQDKNVSLRPNYRRRWNNEYLHRFLEALQIPKESVDVAAEHICIGLNKPIFSLQKRVKPSHSSHSH